MGSPLSDAILLDPAARISRYTVVKLLPGFTLSVMILGAE